MASRGILAACVMTMLLGPALVAQSWDTQALVREAGALTAETLPDVRNRAAEGDARSQALLGLAYEMGSAGLTPDSVVALEWFRKAADQGADWAEMWAGDFYYTGAPGVPRDLYEAMRLYQSAARRGNLRAAFYAGRMYFFGEGVAVNQREAADWFRRALPADRQLVGRMLRLAEAPCQETFCVTVRQLLGADMIRLQETLLGDWDDAGHWWDASTMLPGPFERCGFTSSDRTANGDVENYFCDSAETTDVETGNMVARDVADRIAGALTPDWTRSTEMHEGGVRYDFANAGYPRVRVSYNATPGDAWQRVTVLIGR